MKYIKLFEQFLMEKTYSYGCVMLYFDFPEMQDLHQQIKEDDVFVDPDDPTFGLETEPHCTLLYGLHEEVTLDTIKEIITDFKFGTCSINEASLFENDKFDVLKFDVTGPGLHTCNNALSKLPHTTDYPDYHPHMTVAYLKKGTGKRYIEILNNTNRSLKPKYVVYSQPDGTKTKIKI